MRTFLRKIYAIEARTAVAVSAFGDWWAERAFLRLGKLSSDIPNQHPLKSERGS